MSPADAAALTDEPDWIELWDALKPADDGFETILRRWREWHWTPTDDGRKLMAPSVDGVIALAHLGIMPPKTLPDRPPRPFEAQADAHTWFVSEGRAWRVLGIEDGLLCLNSFGDERQITLEPASKWVAYCEQHNAALEAMRAKP